MTSFSKPRHVKAGSQSSPSSSRPSINSVQSVYSLKLTWIGATDGSELKHGPNLCPFVNFNPYPSVDSKPPSRNNAKQRNKSVYKNDEHICRKIWRTYSFWCSIGTQSIGKKSMDNGVRQIWGQNIGTKSVDYERDICEYQDRSKQIEVALS